MQAYESPIKEHIESLAMNSEEEEADDDWDYGSFVSTLRARWLSNESEDQHPEYTSMAHPTINSSYSLSYLFSLTTCQQDWYIERKEACTCAQYIIKLNKKASTRVHIERCVDFVCMYEMRTINKHTSAPSSPRFFLAIMFDIGCVSLFLALVQQAKSICSVTCCRHRK